MDEDKFKFAPQKCPCHNCEDRHPGCHTVLCPHGWYEWNEYMAQRRDEIAKEKEQLAAWYRYRTESLRKMKDRAGSIKQNKKGKGIRP